MVAHESNLESFAAINRVGDAGTPDDESSRFNAGEFLKLLQFCNEGLLVLLADIGTELEQH